MVFFKVDYAMVYCIHTEKFKSSVLKALANTRCMLSQWTCGSAIVSGRTWLRSTCISRAYCWLKDTTQLSDADLLKLVQLLVDAKILLTEVGA
jgi:hypothetical protein